MLVFLVLKNIPKSLTQIYNFNTLQIQIDGIKFYLKNCVVSLQKI